MSELARNTRLKFAVSSNRRRPLAHPTHLTLYKARPDKGYSLTDCISMHAMRERGISDILTHDDHFRQEGFTVLL
jgi:hypothetical protein